MNYVIEANIGFAFLYGMYLLILERENDFRKQRIALLGILSCALIFPLLRLPAAIDTVEMATITLPEVVIGGNVTISSSNFSWIYGSISLLIAIPVLLTAIKLYRISIKEDGRYQGHYLIIESERDLPSWSFFNLIYIGRANELSEEDKDLIIRYEMLHGELLHSLDMLLITLLCIVFWFNPVLWIMRRTIAKVHEFEVDSIIAEQSGAVDYSVLLAKTALSRNGFLLTHHFNQSFIIKRINMINMIKNKISGWKLAGLSVAVVIYLAAAACTEPMANKTKDDAGIQKLSIDKSGAVHTIVEVPPAPVDGLEEFMSELRGEIQYPSAAREAGTQGTVFIEFIVNTDGTLSDFSVKKGVSPELDAEALRVVSKLKAWTPGNHDGSVVRTQLVLPISFKLD